MDILVTGASGFIGRNLCEALARQGHSVLQANSHTSITELDDYLSQADFVYHLAATHRPKDFSDFQTVNVEYFRHLLQKLTVRSLPCPVAFMSSIQAGNGSDYGNSKVAGEKLLREYGKLTGARTHVLRLTNTFGKYAKPNHTSVVATFCYNLSHSLPIVVNNPDAPLNLCYIDFVINELLRYLEGPSSTEKAMDEKDVIHTTVGELARKLQKIAGGELNVSPTRFDIYLQETYRWYQSLQ